MQIKIEKYFTNLQQVLDELKKRGVKPEDYKNFKFQQDYSNCYYESDTPDILLRDD